jgi:hypothetical protein
VKLRKLEAYAGNDPVQPFNFFPSNGLALILPIDEPASNDEHDKRTEIPSTLLQCPREELGKRWLLAAPAPESEQAEFLSNTREGDRLVSAGMRRTRQEVADVLRQFSYGLRLLKGDGHTENPASTAFQVLFSL